MLLLVSFFLILLLLIFKKRKIIYVHRCINRAHVGQSSTSNITNTVPTPIQISYGGVDCKSLGKRRSSRITNLVQNQIQIS